MSAPPPPISHPRRRIWDTGPTRPAELDRLPTDETEIRQHARLLKAYSLEYAEWLKSTGGPVEIDLYATTAAEFLQRDPRRYLAELPPDTKPGWKRDGARVILE